MNDTSFETPYLKTLHTSNNIYDRFVPDQVLTHHNLNKIIDYFEDQDRLSRINTIGVGIGCGLDFFVETDQGGNITIKVNAGVGITTDGDLVVVNTSGSQQTAYEFRYFTNPNLNRANYERFNGLDIVEIHTQEEADSLQGEQPLSSLFNLNGQYLLIYVENYNENPGKCNSSGCDDTGEHIYRNLKFLLTDQAGFDMLTAEDTDSIFYYKKMRSFYDTLPELSVIRPILKSSNTKAQNSIYNLYKSGIESNNVATQLRDSFIQIIDKLDNRLNVKRFNITENNIISRFDPLIIIGSFPILDIQYRYDFLKDLIDTYNEIRALLLHINADCVPNTDAFPKHLLLGAINQDKREFSRHSFYPSHMVDNHDENLLHILSLIIRFYSQLDQYNIPSNGALVVNSKPSSTAFNNVTIKITPSKGYDYILSQRSIPYYYKAQSNLTKNWNFVDIVNRRAKAQLSYHKSNLLNIDLVQNPLKYNNQGFDFYRIEGHLGKTYTSVLSKLAQLQTDFNLNFQVKAISIGAALDTIDLDDYSCQFEDLRTLLKAWQDEFQCQLKNGYEFFKKYSYNVLGDNATSTSYVDYVREPLALEKPVAFNEKAAVLKAAAATEAPLLISEATDYAIEVTKSTDPEILYKVASEYMIRQVGSYDNVEEALVYVDYPAKIALDLYAVEQEFVNDLQIYTEPTGLARFTKSLDQLCFDLNKAKEDIVTARTNQTFGTKNRDSMYEFMIYELSKLCCFKSKIQWLLTEIETRKKNIFDQLTLSELVKKNPGIEHMAGVPKGGTFIIVYGGRDTTTGSFSNKVIADFAYHDLCCNDCPPSTIVIQQEVPIIPGLLLEPSVYCIKDGQMTEKGTFTSTPSYGIITSDQGTDFIEEENSFDPNIVAENLLGLPITFKVDQTPVSVTATVYRIPDPVIFNGRNNPKIIPTLNIDGVSASVTITPTTPYDTKGYLTYSWLDESGLEIGTSRILTIPEIPIIGNRISKNLRLIIGINNPESTCTTEVNIDIDIEINSTPDDAFIQPIKPIVLYKNGEEETRIDLNPIPEGGIITSPKDNPNNSFISGNKLIPAKVPSELLGTPISFIVNNDTANQQQITVYGLPGDTYIANSDNYSFDSDDIQSGDQEVTITDIELRLPDTSNFNYQLNYTVLDENENEVEFPIQIPIESDNAGNTRIDHEFTIQMGVEGVDDPECVETYTVVFQKPVTVPDDEIEDDEEKTCFDDFNERIGNYRFNNELKKIESEINSTSEFGIKFIQEIIQPTSSLFEDVLKLKEIEFNNKDKLKTRLNQINDLLEILSKNYIQNPDRKEFLTQFRVLHEMLSILFLELTKCCSSEDISILNSEIEIFTKILEHDQKFFEEINISYVHITQKFFDTYNTEAEDLRTVLINIFNFK